MLYKYKKVQTLTPEGAACQDAAKDAGPAILDSIKDDVSTYSPFPKSSLSERMEVEDVWNRARANTKPAGKLDGDAASAKNTIENAESQAESQAYLAANEAAATDAYDVSFPNPDMMAKGSGKPMATQALAGRRAHGVAAQAQVLARQHLPQVLAGQAQAEGSRSIRREHSMLRSRLQALHEVEQTSQVEGAGSEQVRNLRALLAQKCTH